MNRIMKKIVVFIIAVVLCGAFVSCSEPSKKILHSMGEVAGTITKEIEPQTDKDRLNPQRRRNTEISNVRI